MSLLSGFFNLVADYWLSIQGYLPAMLKGCLMVVKLIGEILLLSWACGLVAALGKMSKIKIIQIPSRFYIWFIRGTPTLIQIYIWYFGLPQLGIRLSPFVAGVLALGINSGAYVAEMVRSGILAIPTGQFESSQALGMSYFLYMRRIILPQVIRVITPPITNEAVQMLKNTSLLMVITVEELLLSAQVLISRTFRPFDFYIIAALLYLVMTTFFTALSGRVEKKLNMPYARS